MKFSYKSTRKGDETQVALKISRRAGTAVALFLLVTGCLIVGFDPTLFLALLVTRG